jgi:hypothetical protein
LRLNANKISYLFKKIYIKNHESSDKIIRLKFETNNKKMSEKEFDFVKSLQPEEQLHKLANKWNIDYYSKEFALKLDQSNLWTTYRDRFYYPKIIDLPKGNKKLNDLI